MVQRHTAPPTRREFLGCACRCSTALAALTVLPYLQSCAGAPEDDAPRVAWSELPDGARVVVRDGSLPIEVTRDGEELHARSLLCTHQGCEVEWAEASGQYICPCHEGIFDASGRPVMGPPREPLREFTVERRDDYVRIDTRAKAE
jgi:cytochrome b6-f complex iron-sulfur subunit